MSLKNGFRPATLTQYTRMWKDFLAFQVAAGLSLHQVTPLVLLAYMQYLINASLSESNISNNLAAIRAFHIIHGLPTHPFQDRRIPLLLKSIKINRPFAPKIAQCLTIDTLHQVMATSAGLQHNITFTALYSFVFFSFLRLSNLLPHTTKQYDFTRHMARGDVIFTQFGATVIIKWSKTIQDRKETRTINVPYLGASQICPIVALKTMLCHIPGSENDPLFMITKKGIPMVLTDSVARKHLKKVSQLLHIQPPLTFHAFRRAASSWAFQHGVPLEHIQAHGTWKSNAVWSYLRALPSSSSPVAQTFSKHLHT